MRFISTRAHGYIDYLMGIVLIISPWIFGFSNAGPGAVWTPVAIGVLLLGASLMTNYELGAVKLIPMPIHLATDMLAGVVLIISPWVLGFSDRIWIPHVVLGILELGVALMTRKRPHEAATLSTGPAPSAPEKRCRNRQARNFSPASSCALGARGERSAAKEG